jgi:hypothetical protein
MPSKFRILPLSLLLFLAAPALPALAGESSEAPPFPLPVMAPVLDPEELSASLSVTSYGVTTDGDSVEIRFAKPFALPDVFRYRVELHVGDPDGAQQRVSFVVDEGDQSGVVEEGEGDDWNEIGTVDAEFREDDGVLLLGLPSEFADALDAETPPLAWVEAELLRESSGSTETYVTPLVPATDLLAPDEGTLRPADEAWGSADQPPDPPVPTGTAPSLRLEGGGCAMKSRGDRGLSTPMCEGIAVLGDDGRGVV